MFPQISCWHLRLPTFKDQAGYVKGDREVRFSIEGKAGKPGFREVKREVILRMLYL